jgi:hypothetical protein
MNITAYVSYQIEQRICDGWIKVRDFDGYWDYGVREFYTFADAKKYVDYISKRNPNIKLRIVRVQTNTTVLDSTGQPERLK